MARKPSTTPKSPPPPPLATAGDADAPASAKDAPVPGPAPDRLVVDLTVRELLALFASQGQ